MPFFLFSGLYFPNNLILIILQDIQLLLTLNLFHLFVSVIYFSVSAQQVSFKNVKFVSKHSIYMKNSFL